VVGLLLDGAVNATLESQLIRSPNKLQDIIDELSNWEIPFKFD
jgi:hypothetical protein